MICDCYFKSIAESNSPEGLKFKGQNYHINFLKCRYDCPCDIDDVEDCPDYVSIHDITLEEKVEKKIGCV